jgi:hypothetical protein
LEGDQLATEVDAMNIGILGAGRMGQALARLFADAGHEVIIANSRGPDTLREIVAALGPRATAGTSKDVAVAGDVVILATRWEQTADAVRDLPLDGKIVIDTTNNRFGPNPEDVYDLGDRASSEVVAEHVPRSRVVKAFNHQPIPALLGVPNAPETFALFIAGDDGEAKDTVADLIRDIGGEPIDTGSLSAGGRLMGTGRGPLAGHGRLLTVAEARDVLADRVAKR